MKKLFLISLMALCTCVMAFAEDQHVTDITGLKAAVANASVGTIYLDKDIQYTGTTTGSEIRILRSVTIDGQGHTIKGYGMRTSSVGNVFSINQGGGSGMVDVVFRNINMIINFPATSNDRLARVIETRGNIRSIELDNVTMGVEDETKTIAVGLQLGGNQASKANITITNSTISVGKSGYPVLSWNPYEMTASNSTFSGYCGLYFKGVNSSAGSAGTIVNADACNFDAPNAHAYADGWNNFGVFTTEDANITINLNNCGMNAQEVGLANQGMILAKMAGCVVNISGDNSHINGHMVLEDSKYPGYWLCTLALTGSLSITGGTYSTNPAHVGPFNPYRWYGSQNPSLPDEDVYVSFVPAGCEVQEVKQGEVTLYRVVKSVEKDGSGDPLYDLNDNVETKGAGENPATSFELSSGTNMTLDQEETTAGYVQIKDNESGDGTTVTVGTDTQDQTLVINNGLDVQGNSQVIVEAGSTLQIGEGGINTEKPENIVIEADENGAASLIMDPAITVNQTPNLTVRMTAKQIGKLGSDYYWHRFALPVAAGITSWEKEGNLSGTTYPTYLYGWNYAGNDWIKLPNGVKDMVPLQGYTLTLASDEIPGLTTLQDVTYIFKGNLVGNTDQALNFQAEGFNFFGNSYTGYMDVLKLIEGIESDKVEGTVYMWCNDPADEDGNYQSYVGVPLYKLANPAQRARLAKWQQEVAPMQTFILRLRGADSADESVSYASAIWGNPRYGNEAPKAPRRRVASINEDTYMEIAVKAANGKGSRVDFTESANNSDDFESGYDVVKYMNENSINFYATINGEDFSSVVTNNIVGKTLSLKTNGEIAYTMSFKNVEGEEYAIRDNVTGQVIAIEEGAAYEFAAQPNSVIEGRFEIVSRANAPTAIENTDVKANVKGIYTIMGQYLGEDFNALPAGVYVVDGVKIVK